MFYSAYLISSYFSLILVCSLLFSLSMNKKNKNKQRVASGYGVVVFKNTTMALMNRGHWNATGIKTSRIPRVFIPSESESGLKKL